MRREDVTEQKQLEVLWGSEHRFRTLADGLPQLVWTAAGRQLRLFQFQGDEVHRGADSEVAGVGVAGDDPPAGSGADARFVVRGAQGRGAV